MCGLEASENVDVPVLQDTRCRVVSALVQLCPQLQPPITVDVVALDGPLGSLELIKLRQGLISSATDCVNVPIVSLGISEVCPARRHVLALLQDIPSQNILIILSRVRPANHEGAKPRIRYDCLVSLGHHRRGDLYLAGRPRIGLGVCVIEPDVRVQERAQLVTAAFTLARVSILLDLPLLPFDVLKRKVDEGWPDEHALMLQEPRYDMLVEPLAENLQLDLLLEFEVHEDLLECERFENQLTQSFNFLVVEIVPQHTIFFVDQLKLLLRKYDLLGLFFIHKFLHD